MKDKFYVFYTIENRGITRARYVYQPNLQQAKLLVRKLKLGAAVCILDLRRERVVWKNQTISEEKMYELMQEAVELL